LKSSNHIPSLKIIIIYHVPFAGIIPRAISEIFSIIEDKASTEKDVYFYVRISYVELYNNNFRNLLEFASKELRAKENQDLSEVNEDNRVYSSQDSADAKDYFGYTSRSTKGTYQLSPLHMQAHFHGIAGQRSTSPTSLHPAVSSRSDKIEVRESQSAGVFLAGSAIRIPVTSAQEAFTLISKGNKSRAVGATQCNEVSSRYIGGCKVL
jgi:hypothetical protein